MKRQGQRQKKYKGNDKDKGSRYDVGFRQIDRGALCNRRLSSEYWRSNHWFLMDWKDINEPTKLYVPWNIWLDFFFSQDVDIPKVAKLVFDSCEFDAEFEQVSAV